MVVQVTVRVVVQVGGGRGGAEARRARLTCESKGEGQEEVKEWCNVAGSEGERFGRRGMVGARRCHPRPSWLRIGDKKASRLSCPCLAFSPFVFPTPTPSLPFSRALTQVQLCRDGEAYNCRSRP